MKTMTCRDLGGACDKAFQAESFEEIAEMSRLHGMEMYRQGDADHLRAMEEMRVLMQSPEAMQAWMAERKAAFNAKTED